MVPTWAGVDSQVWDIQSESIYFRPTNVQLVRELLRMGIVFIPRPNGSQKAEQSPSEE